MYSTTRPDYTLKFTYKLYLHYACLRTAVAQWIRYCATNVKWGPKAVAQWLRYCATNVKWGPTTVVQSLRFVFVCYIRAPSQGLWLHCSHLGLLYALFSRSSHCRRQMSPRPTRRERSKRREGEL
jgi:hypothetical protein